MKTSTKRILSIGFAGLLFIGILVVVTGLIRPEITKVNEKRATVASKENIFESERNAVDQVQNIIGQFQSITELQETVSLALPLDENVTGVLNQIQSISNLANVELGSFSIRPLNFESSKQQLVRRLGTLELTLTASGNYEGIKQFLRFIENNVRIINVRSLSFAPTSVSISDNFTLNLTVETYYQE